MKLSIFLTENELEKLTGGNASADTSDNPVDVISVDVPLFLRLLEYAKEDAQSDMDLHDVAERAVQLMQDHNHLCMDNYDELVGSSGNALSEAEKPSSKDSLETWIKKFKNSTNPRFAGKSPEKREEMARAAYNRTIQNKKVSEEKQKGLDGKKCWDGYKRMGTKMKGGKRVDNCVPIKKGK
jgi:hypothetical protein